MAETTETDEEIPREEEIPRLPEGLLARLRADPVHAAEHIALEAARYHGPAAARWIADKRATYAYDGARLAKMAKQRHSNIARASGAALGLGGVWTMVPDLAALAWIQGRMVYFIAGAYGFDPTDRMRPAELLVIQGIYHHPIAAREALDGLGPSIARAYAGKQLSGAENDALVRRLLKLVGAKGAEKVAGKFIPGFAALFNSVVNARDTRRLADRAIAFYGG